MAKTVVGLFENFGQAEKAVQDLMQFGINRSRIGAMSTQPTATSGSSAVEDKERKAATVMTGVGAATIGGLSLAMGVGPVPIPGIGLVVAAGALAAGLAGAGIGATLPKILRKLGVPEAQGDAYAEGMRRGGTLVTAESLNDNEADRAVAVMKKHGAVDIQKRAQEWQRSGWSGRLPDTKVPGGMFTFSPYEGADRRSSRQSYLGVDRRSIL